jgi:hypothetical protein
METLAKLAIDGTIGEARSALPDAPVVPDGEPRRPAVRLALASLLHRVADRLEPTWPATADCC